VYQSVNMQRKRGIAFIGNYLPRACGIATFTYDLAEAVATRAGDDQSVVVTAINDIATGYAYPDRVKFEIRQNNSVDYTKAADFLNFSNIDVVSLQHEYGIFGGKKGANILSFLKRLNRPVVTTCHTILENPTHDEREILIEIAAHSYKLVVMSQRAYHFLEESYGISAQKIAFIPHGIHHVPFIDPNFFKDKFSLEGQKVILTFGLLTRNKGIEYMINAMPRIIERHPNTTYVVLGATHPAIIREEGESYRLSLQRTVRKLGLERNVLFYPEFVELSELLEYLGASDIFVTPYLYMEQITSGALSYAMGTGKAVVSTPYWHAEELLDDGRGVLVPTRDAEALARAINDLLDDEVKLSAMRKRAYLYCQNMVWSKIAGKYLDLFDEARQKVSFRQATTETIHHSTSAIQLPAPRLNHILRLTDDTGPAVFARHSIPDWTHGYSLDTAAATLITSCKFHEIHKTTESLQLCERCLTLMHTLIGHDAFHSAAARLDYSRRRQGSASDVDLGKAIWSLGYVIWQGPAYLSSIANDMLHQIIPDAPIASPRGAAYAILGAASYLERFPGAAAMKRFLIAQLPCIRKAVASDDWYCRWGAADWPIAVQVFYVAAATLNDDSHSSICNNLLEQMNQVTENGGLFEKHGDNKMGEELPVTAAMYIESLATVFHTTDDRNLLTGIRTALDWFLGENRIGESLYNFSTGGCHDALFQSGLNRNQGTEATVYCLLAFLTLNQISWAKISD
jgi:glycosyltransferase involved in cell wall biosynthesis